MSASLPSHPNQDSLRSILDVAFGREARNTVHVRIENYLKDVEQIDDLRGRFGETGICSKILLFERNMEYLDIKSCIDAAKTDRNAVLVLEALRAGLLVEHVAQYAVEALMGFEVEQNEEGTVQIIADNHDLIVRCIERYSENPKIRFSCLSVLQRLQDVATGQGFSKHSALVLFDASYRLLGEKRPGLSIWNATTRPMIADAMAQIESTMIAGSRRVWGENNPLLSFGTMLRQALHMSGNYEAAHNSIHTTIGQMQSSIQDFLSIIRGLAWDQYLPYNFSYLIAVSVDNALAADIHRAFSLGLQDWISTDLKRVLLSIEEEMPMADPAVHEDSLNSLSEALYMLVEQYVHLLNENTQKVTRRELFFRENFHGPLMEERRRRGVV